MSNDNLLIALMAEQVMPLHYQ